MKTIGSELNLKTKDGQPRTEKLKTRPLRNWGIARGFTLIEVFISLAFTANLDSSNSVFTDANEKRDLCFRQRE